MRKYTINEFLPFSTRHRYTSVKTTDFFTLILINNIKDIYHSLSIIRKDYKLFAWLLK